MRKEQVTTIFTMLNFHLKDKLSLRFVNSGYWKSKGSRGHINHPTQTINCNWRVLKNSDYSRTVKFLLHEIGHSIHRKYVLDEVTRRCAEMDTSKMKKVLMETHDISKAVGVMGEDIREIGAFVKENMEHDFSEKIATEKGDNFYCTTFLKGGIQI